MPPIWGFGTGFNPQNKYDLPPQKKSNSKKSPAPKLMASSEPIVCSWPRKRRDFFPRESLGPRQEATRNPRPRPGGGQTAGLGPIYPMWRTHLFKTGNSLGGHRAAGGFL